MRLVEDDDMTLFRKRMKAGRALATGEAQIT
jgi:hypothetical protein